MEKKARVADVTTDQLQKVFSDMSERLTGDRMEIPTIEEYFLSWLKSVQNKNSTNTYIRYECSTRRFLKFLGSNATKPVTALSPRQIDAFLQFRLEAGMAPKTVSLDVKTLGVALKKAERFGIIPKNPVPAVEMPKMVSSEREVFTLEEVQSLIEAAPNLDWQTAIYFGYFAGARLSDCVKMKWENVNPDTKSIIYTQKKTGKKMDVPMNFHLLNHLAYRSEHSNSGYICPSLANKNPGGHQGLSQTFKRIAKRAGVDLGIVQGKGVRKFTKRSFHSLRHSFISALANAGVSEEIRMQLTGHMSKETHAKYSHFDRKLLENAIDTLTPGGTE